eukprot:2120172-Amphidinium_carterae.1
MGLGASEGVLQLKGTEDATGASRNPCPHTLPPHAIAFVVLFQSKNNRSRSSPPADPKPLLPLSLSPSKGNFGML